MMTIINNSGVFHIERIQKNGLSYIKISIPKASQYAPQSIELNEKKLTYKVLKAQLAQLGVGNVDLKTVDKNQNNYLDAEEVPLLDEFLEKNAQAVRYIIKNNKNVSLFENVHESLKKNKEFFIELIKNNITLENETENQVGIHPLQYAHESLKKDRQFILEVCKQDASAFRYADTSLKQDRKFLSDVIDENPDVFQDIDESLKRDSVFILERVKRNARVLSYINYSLLQDRDFVLRAVKENGHALSYIHESLQKDREIVLAAINQNGLAIGYAHETFRKDEKVALVAIKKDAWAFYGIDENLQKSSRFQELAWNTNIVSSNFFIKPSLSLQKRQQTFEKEFKKLKINHGFLRFQTSASKVNELIANRNVNSKDNRSIALMVYPTHDWNLAFMQPQIDDLMQHGYRVIYVEASTDNDFYQAVETYGKKQKISILIVAGHGSGDSLAFSEEDPAYNKKGNEKKYLDLSDENDAGFKKLSSYIEDQSVVILESCSAGVGGKLGKNIANMFKKRLKKSTIFAPKTPDNTQNYVFDKNHKIKDVIYYSINDHKKYKIGD